MPLHGSWNQWFIDSCMFNATVYSRQVGPLAAIMHVVPQTRKRRNSVIEPTYTIPKMVYYYRIYSHQDLQILYNMVGSTVLTYLIPQQRA